MEKVVYIFKIKFKSLKFMSYGVVFFSLNAETGDIGFKEALVSLKPGLFHKIELEMTWSEIKKELFEISISRVEDITQSMSHDVMKVITEALENDEIRKSLFNDALEDNIPAAKERIRDILKEVISGRIELEFDIEKIDSSAKEEDKGEEGEGKPGEEKTEEIKEEEKKYIKIDIVNDPVWGKEVSKLEKDEKVYCVISDENYKDIHFQRGLESYCYGEHIASFVDYIENEKDPEQSQLILKLDKGYYGICNVYKKVKIKPLNMPGSSAVDSTGLLYSNALAVYVGAVFIGMVFILLVWFYYNWLLF